MDEGRLDDAWEMLAAVPAEQSSLYRRSTLEGMILSRKNENFASLRRFQQAAIAAPDLTMTLGNLSRASYIAGHDNLAMATARRLNVVMPTSAAYNILGYACLRLGRDAEGFGYLLEAFRRKRHLLPKLAERLWAGEDLRGRTLALYVEGGLGDGIMGFRYLAGLRAAGARLVLEVQAPLVGLVHGAADVILVRSGHPFGREALAAEPFDWQIPLLLLPHVLGASTGQATVKKSYLEPDSAALNRWRAYFLATCTLNVGLAWVGSVENPTNHTRSFSSVEFGPLLEKFPNVRFHSLQVGPEAAQAAGLEHLGLIDIGPRLADGFVEAAAAVSALDLVITVDSVYAHLAGAVGTPCWVLLSALPDWRWGTRGTHTRWYDSVRLFRQREVGTWISVMEEIKEALREWSMLPNDSSS